MTRQTIEERTRLDAIGHFGITEEQFDAIREILEGSLYYANRRLYHAWSDIKLAVRGSFRKKRKRD